MIRILKMDKRIFVAAGLVCLLVVVAVINQVVNKSTTASGGGGGGPAAASAFAAYRAERNLTRQREVEYLDSIIQNQDTETNIRNQAQEQKLTLTGIMEAETNIETVLKTKGLKDCVVVYREDSCNIMVNLPQLSTAQVAQVVEAVCGHTDLTCEQIKIVPAA
ncbi:MAG: SpoIIIAH-like family protein [Clostridia bacterium]|nr:SpoIIIAH-like family protein [Clostridia bacterium]